MAVRDIGRFASAQKLGLFVWRLCCDAEGRAGREGTCAQPLRPKMLPFLILGQPMSNIASVLKEEISRVARREIKRETSALKKASSAYRSDIAALKRRLQELERQLRRASRGRE